MSRSKLYLRFFLLGGAAFWLPDMLFNWIIPPTMVRMTMFMMVPPIFILFWMWAGSHKKLGGHLVSMPSCFLFGIWFFGPPAMFLGQRLGGAPWGGDGLLENIGWVFGTWAFFPFTTFMMSAYHGSMGGLFIISLLLLAAIAIGGIKRMMGKRREGNP
ncbi:MAG: hypothetical protein GY747_03260 [Planctomycetes bacterium]|nr:hypothetical protein [Planctomycetota bacterium]